jgi:hypothetical protein
MPEGVAMDRWYYRLRDQQWRDYDQRESDGSSWLRDMDALYLFGTIGTEAILRGDGEVWVRPDEHWGQANAPQPQWRPANEQERTSALVIACKRMPDVGLLLPTRPPTATNCLRCSGSGWLLGEIVCPDCAGLGWIVTEHT